SRFCFTPWSEEHSIAEPIVKCLDVDLELLFNYTLCLRGIVFRIVARAGISAGMRKHFAYSKLFRDHGPVFLQALESATEVRNNFAVGVDKPIKLVMMRRGMNARAATILNPTDELIERHLLTHLHCLIAPLVRDEPASGPAIESAL